MSEEIPTGIIMDVGSGTTKAGIAGDLAPSVYLPTLTGTTKTSIALAKEHYIGKEVLEKKGVLDITQPVQKGKITDWDSIETLWEHCLTERLKVDPADHPIVYGFCPSEKKVAKERTVLIYFESLGVPGFFCAMNPLLSIYGAGRTNGLVVDSGEEMTSVISIIDGNKIEGANAVYEMGGSDVTKYMQRLFKEKQIIVDIEEAQKVKEDLCYSAMDYTIEYENFKRGETAGQFYQLPDGMLIEVAEEMVKAPELIFNQKLVGKYEPGLQEIMNACVQGVEGDHVKRELLQNVVLSGGNTKIRDFVYRVNKELISSCGTSLKCRVKILAGDNREFLSWSGGSVISTLKSFRSMWITRGDYNEFGPSIVHRKCL